MFQISLPMLQIISAILLLFPFLCFANVPIKLDIQGTTMFTDFIIRPSGGYTAELTGATSTGEYEWDISVSTPYANFVGTPQGKHATIEFTSAPSTSEGELMVTILCKTYYMDGNQRKSESAHLNVTWKCPRLTYGINGNTEVLDGIEETYAAWVAIENQNPTVRYFWKKGDSQGSGIEANPFTTTFNSEDGQNVTLCCDIEAGDILLKAQTEIHVNAYAMSVERWDYSGYLDNGPPGKRKIIHNHSTTSDDENVYIHYNIDDDDENNEYDFKQKAFKRSERDDDLCELKIEIIVEGEFSVDDLDKSITITTTPGLRLWKSQYRGPNDFLQGGDGKDEPITKTWPVSSIINNGEPIYIEGIKYNSDETLTITFGKITKMLKYKTCSVGDEHNQPDLELRNDIKKVFKNLVDCEWYVIRPENPTYNCIAFSVDPYLNVFKDVDYKGSPQIRSNMKIDPNYPYPFWVDKVCFNRISPPQNQNDTADKFWLSLEFTGGDRKYFILGKYLYGLHLFSTNDFRTWQEKSEEHGDIISVLGHKTRFKETIVPAITILQSSIIKDSAQYYLTMNDFNPSGELRVFDWNNDVNAFFTSDVWKNNSGKNLKKCDDSDDPNRIIRFYTEFHAARRASTLEGKEKVEETDMPPGWYIFASKCGDWVTIIHREEQICGEYPAYGQKDKSYKY